MSNNRYHIDLAFSSNYAKLGSAFGQPSAYYPLQFALIDGSSSRFTMGPNGGFSGGDSFQIRVYDISSLSGGVIEPQDPNAAILLFSTTVNGVSNIQTAFSSYPVFSRRTPQGDGWTYDSLTYHDSNSSAYGEDLPSYAISTGSKTDPPDFEWANPSASTSFKLSFGFVANGRTYIVDPEMLVDRSGG